MGDNSDFASSAFFFLKIDYNVNKYLTNKKKKMKKRKYLFELLQLKGFPYNDQYDHEYKYMYEQVY